MRVIYGGPLDGVELTVPDGRTVVALRGEVIDVPAEFGESLTEQDIWNKAPASSKRATAVTSEGDD